MMEDLHFGNMILAELRKQRYSVAWFAKEMGSTRGNMYKILSKRYLNTDFLLRAMQLLHHDFFFDASEILNKTQKKEDGID